MRENYILRNKNIDVMKFTVNGGTELYIEDVAVIHTDMLPRYMKTLHENPARVFEQWIKNRIISSNRIYLKEILRSIGLHVHDQIGMLLMIKGLGLNDTFWVAREGSNDLWENVNLYDNEFKDALEYVTFFGHSKSLGGKLRCSPSITTAGVLPKVWRFENGKQYLYKAGTSRYANANREPLVEVLAYCIGRLFGIEIVEQKLTRLDGVLCTVSENFTDVNESFVPASEFYSDRAEWDFDTVVSRLGFKDDIVDMFIFDYIIGNKDRHHNNFGLIVSSVMGNPIRFAPVWDHGASILYSAMDMDFPINHEEDYEQLVNPNSRELVFSILEPRHKSRIQAVLNNLDEVFKDQLKNTYNKKKTIITDEYYENMKTFIQWRCEDLLSRL